MKPKAQVFEMTSLKKQYKITQCCFFTFFFKMACMCDLLYSLSIYCIYELLFLIIQQFCIAPNLYPKSCYELEVITYCFCHGRRKVLLARNN